MQTVSINGQQITVHHITGKVEEAGKNLETKISGSGGGGFTYRGTGGTAPVSIKSTTVIHDQFFITDDAGREHSFQLQGFNVACRSGNRLSVLWGVKGNKKSGPYIAVYNHSTSAAFYNGKAMAGLFRRPVIYLIAALVVLIILGSTSSLFYWLLPAAFFYWFAEGLMGANRFKREFNFSRLGATDSTPTIGEQAETLPVQ